MKQQIADVVQLYENTIASQGYARAECVSGVARSQEERMAHARHVLDSINQHAERDRWPAGKVLRLLGFVQGILWSEQQFNLEALNLQISRLEDRSRATQWNVKPATESDGSDDEDDADVAFAEGPLGGGIPIKLPE